MNNNEFKYDVAFSFLQQDEPTATQINDLLQDRVSTFLYSRRQGEVAGTDGEKTFNQVFGRDARVVVVLYRDDWGQTPWTRIEETAIRNRGFEKGYDFAVFVRLDKNSIMPEWLPKNRIWIGLEQWGVKGAATVIEARVQEAGGKLHEETAEEKAKRIIREIEAKEKRESFLESRRGVEAANNEVKFLFLEVERITDEIADPEAGIVFKIEHLQRPTEFSVGSHGFIIFFEWCLQISNSLQGSLLFVQLLGSKEGGWRKRRDAYGDGPSIIKEEKICFNVSAIGQYGWHLEDRKEQLMSTSQLADYCVKILLEQIRESRISDT